ncbi:unnamed protein product, partial [Polarella glacialis]
MYRSQRWQHSTSASKPSTGAILEPYGPGKALQAVVGLCREQRWGEALGAYEELKSRGLRPNTVLRNGVISTLGRRRRWELAWHFLKKTASEGCELDAVSFNAAATASAADNQWPQTLELLCRTIEGSDGVSPDVFTFNSALTSFSRASLWAASLKVLRQMVARSAQPDMVTFNSAVSSAEKGCQWKQAISLLREASQRQLGPGIAALGAGISAADKSGRWPLALELLGYVASCGVQPGQIVFGATLSALEKGKCWEKGLSLWRELRSRGIETGIISGSSVLSATSKCQQWELGLELLGELRRADGPSAGILDVVALSAAIGACEVASLWQGSLGLLSEMRDSGMQLDATAFGAT